MAATASATVTEPSNQVVPIASGDPVQLNQYFASVGEAIDWKVDAASGPNAFSPLCGFDAKFVLHGAACALHFAWYNETGSPPSSTDLHVIIPAGSAVGTTFSGTDIKSDPAYKGGLVGFALVGSPTQQCTETHYSNPAWNRVCSGCNPVAPWITTLIYPSRNVPNAFYLAFEDGPTGATSFNNDGDFNDDVYIVSGVTCVGGGQACDTGKPGICASGFTQCTANGTTCKPSTAGTAEKCNGLDDNCDGQTDEGDLCPSGQVCDKGTCVGSCASGEFACPGDKVCNANGHCVDPRCKDVTCDAGKVCVAGTCKGACDDVVCPHGQTCRAGTCADSCAGVTCESGQVCDNGACVTSCDCLPCTGGKSCDTASGLCIEAACAGVTCTGGQHCQAGNCVDACSGAVCPAGQTCEAGNCVDKPATDSDGGVDGGGGGLNGPGASPSDGPADGGTLQSASVDDSSGCGCVVAGGGGGEKVEIAGLALAIATAFRRRRTRR
ncbi:hypothetical protein AKJ09_04153 [Labilithrix luteola]|uniref:Follistatin-like domain-containing protein n=1 Tax=Labilithrix luteola TaxID=1391654 RepID=A0A0K1PWH0_9BACT|nr:hypothetical protein AKJ09_04153 [Labilithrix luteola]